MKRAHLTLSLSAFFWLVLAVIFGLSGKDLAFWAAISIVHVYVVGVWVLIGLEAKK